MTETNSDTSTAYGRMSPLGMMPISNFHGKFVARVGTKWCCPIAGTGHSSPHEAAYHAADVMLALYAATIWQEGDDASFGSR